MDSKEPIKAGAMNTKTPDGRDELNLAEFPLCALSHRLRPDQKTVQFQDKIRDDGRGEMITRQLTISGSDAYGLPRALDDEVLLGLIQLTRQRGFADRKVPFTRYQLIQLLGWRNESKSYERVEVSLNRWTGVTLYYRNAWWNRAKKCWMSEKFHVLDNVWLCHRCEASGDDDGAASAFVWNEVLFKSFQSGNLKAIDFDFFKSLDSAIAKRLYRFLDKRFFLRDQWEFNLRELAWEHVGLARGYDTASLKRKLLPAIIELEQKGFLVPRPEAERFRKLRAGDWQVTFGKAKPITPGTCPNSKLPESGGLETALITRGVTAAIARTITGQYPAAQIQTQLEAFDWMMSQKDTKVSKNPPGFLVASIRNQYAPPKEFLDREQSQKMEREAAECRRRLEERQQKKDGARQARDQARAEAVEQFWKSLSGDERGRMETEALNQASPFQRKFVRQAGSLGDATRKALLEAYALSLMKVGA